MGILARLIAANCILVISIAPKRAELSSPILPIDKSMSSILPEFIISSILIVLVGWPTILRMVVDDKNWPTLFWIGATASVRNFWSYFSNSLTKKSFMTRSCIFSMTLYRYLGSFI